MHLLWWRPRWLLILLVGFFWGAGEDSPWGHQVWEDILVHTFLDVNKLVSYRGVGGRGGVRVLVRGRGGWILFHEGVDNFAGEIICILECMFRGEIFCRLFGCRRGILGT